MFNKICAMNNYLRLGRPYYVLPVIAAAIAGYYSSSSTHPLYKSGIVGFVFFLLGIACWSANEIADRHSDARGRMKKIWGLYVSGGTTIVSAGIIPIKSATVFAITFALFGLIIAAFLGVIFWLLSVLFLVIGLAYSLKPVRLKEKGVLGLAAVASAYGLVAFTAGWIAGGQKPTTECLLFSGMLSITVFGFEGLAHLTDYEQDLRNNEKTISVSLGQKTARYVLAICQFLPLLTLILLSLLTRSIIPNLKLAQLIPLFFLFSLIAILTAKYQKESLTSSLRVLSVPLITAFAFLIA